MKLVGTHNHATAEAATILDALGNPVVAGRITPAPGEGTPFVHDPECPTPSDFKRYAVWRRTKCKPRDLNNVAEKFEEIDQAIHEFVGEVAELGELVLLLGTDLLLTDVGRAKLLDEIGDVFFCGLWVLDGWEFNPFVFRGAPSPAGFVDARELEYAVLIAARLSASGEHPIDNEEAVAIDEMLKAIVLQVSVLAGLLCNSFKKLRWQGRNQQPGDQALRVVGALSLCTHMLTFAGFTPSDALARNVEKLDARYPDGYTGVGGGNRTGKGA